MPMIILKDIINKHEIASKAYITEEDWLLYKLKGKLIMPDVEDGAEDVEKVIDIPYKQALEEIPDFSKSNFASCMKAVMKAIVKTKKYTEMAPELVEEFKKKTTDWVKSTLENFDNYVFYSHANVEDYTKSFIVLCEWKGEEPWFYLIKDALMEEKV
ncbi:Translationally_controlled tumor protein-like protein [Hexamita inflata]|uniref:Translationally controlled tumor protein-like protein n=1 Tax=Hexamita inflata TaxID=28002 RepID=A0AA86PNP5_9EUKA|nr:Translationally controlled tumor protein-like protein [Hexamita inflata]